MYPLLFNVGFAWKKRIWKSGFYPFVHEIMTVRSVISAEMVLVRNKPINHVFKKRTIWDRGYIFDFFPRSNLHPWREPSLQLKKIIHISAAVASLVKFSPRGQDGQERWMFHIFIAVNFDAAVAVSLCLVSLFSFKSLFLLMLRSIDVSMIFYRRFRKMLLFMYTSNCLFNKKIL